MKKALVIMLVLLAAAGSAFAGGQKETGSSAPEKEMGYEWVMDSSTDGILPDVNPLEVKGDIITAGSSTVFPLSEAMAERFKDEGYSGNITIDSIGSGAGFERFTVAGETDISNASRAIKQKEIDNAAGIGRTPIEFRVGTDAIAVCVNKSNTFVDDISLEDLAKLFSTAETWSDVNPVWPDEEILKFIPGTDSGTFDYFVEVVFDEDAEPILEGENLQLSEDDNILVQGIEGNPYGVGFFGYAYYVENMDSLNILDLDGVEPTLENVDAFTYPLARPLFIYSDRNIMRSKPQVAAFIAYYLTFVNEEIEDVGYFPAGKADMDAAKQRWLDAMEGAY